MIIVTGGSGLIGSNLIEALNLRGISEILVVDNLKNGKKVINIADLNIVDYLDRDDFLDYLRKGFDFGKIDAVFHLGACSATTEWDGQFIMRNNYEYSKMLLHWCQDIEAQFVYASSASVYGLGDQGFREERECEKPINMYAFSKFQFDQYVRSRSQYLKSQVVGLRYFNVYGPREGHKGSMSSTPYHFNSQIISSGKVKLFEGYNGYANGEQKRDFVYVKDCVDVNLWFLDHASKQGIFNVGTGCARSFNSVASSVLNWHSIRGLTGSVEYISFPEHLKGVYQSYTQADLSSLRRVGYPYEFYSIERGICSYLDWLNKMTE